MTNEEAIKKMQAVKVYMISGNPIWSVTETGEAFDMAIEALENNDKLAENLQNCLEMYKKKKAEVEALKQNQWIPCEERLPEPGEYYLVTVQFLGCNGTEYREIDIAEYEYDGWDKANTVLAWCELPKPYEGRTE